MTTRGVLRVVAIVLAATWSVALAACATAPSPDGSAENPSARSTSGAATTGAPAAQTWPRSKVASDTFVAGGGEPTSLDPAQVYEVNGEGLAMSFYDGLVAFRREKPDAFVPALATEWSVSPDGLTYTFTIRPGVRFHEGGTLEPHDAAYAIQRVMLRDASGGPSWLFLQPILGVSAIKDRVLTEAKVDLAEGQETPAMEALPDAAKVAACQAVLDAVTADDRAGTVTVHLHAPTPWFLQLLANWIGSVVDQEWMVQQGDWDGRCADWTRWYDIPAEESVLFDRENGTGPYRLGHYKKKESITLEANDDYWRTEPAWPGGPSGPPRLRHVVLQIVTEWGTQYAKLQAGEWDAIGVPGTQIDQVQPMVGLEYLAGDDEAEPTVVHPDGILKVYRAYPTTIGGAIHFTFEVATEGGNELLGSGKLDGKGIPPDFFSDIHVRKGFNHCFDSATYIRDILHGDGVPMRGPIIQGLQGYRADSPIYAFDLDLCQQELARAWGGRLPQTGFHVLVPITADPTIPTAFDVLADGLAHVNPKFKLETVQTEWPTMLDNMTRQRVPLLQVGWFEDYHDASNWVQAFMHTDGAQSFSRGRPKDLSGRIDALIEQGVDETDPAKRDAIYAQLQRISHDEALAIDGYQTLGRAYYRREVNGWYFNPLLLSAQPYSLWKSEP